MAKLTYQNGLTLAERVIEIPATPHPEFSSCYVFAFPKSGSVLLNNITHALMRETGIPIVDIPAFCYMNGIAIGTALFDIGQTFRPEGYCYSGFAIRAICSYRFIIRSSSPTLSQKQARRNFLLW